MTRRPRILSTRDVKPAKVKSEKLKVLTTRDVKIREKDPVDPEAIANTQSIDTSMVPSGRRRRKK